MLYNWTYIYIYLWEKRNIWSTERGTIMKLENSWSGDMIFRTQVVRFRDIDNFFSKLKGKELFKKTKVNTETISDLRILPDRKKVLLKRERENVINWSLMVVKVQEKWCEIFWVANNYILFSSVSVPQSCPTLCDPTDCSTPGLPVHHQLPEFTQTNVHWVNDAIQPSHPLSSPAPSAFNLSQNQDLFKWVSSSHQVAKILEFQLQYQSFQWILRTDFL